jgi:hypothetical protein
MDAVLMRRPLTSIDDKANSNVNIYIGCEATTQARQCDVTVPTRT